MDVWRGGGRGHQLGAPEGRSVHLPPQRPQGCGERGKVDTLWVLQSAKFDCSSECTTWVLKGTEDSSARKGQR